MRAFSVPHGASSRAVAIKARPAGRIAVTPSAPASSYPPSLQYEQASAPGAAAYAGSPRGSAAGAPQDTAAHGEQGDTAQQGLYGSGLQQAYDRDGSSPEPLDVASYNPEYSNVITMTGTLGFDPEQVQMSSGTMLAKLRIAYPQKRGGDGWYVPTHSSQCTDKYHKNSPFAHSVLLHSIILCLNCFDARQCRAMFDTLPKS